MVIGFGFVLVTENYVTFFILVIAEVNDVLHEASHVRRAFLLLESCL